MSDSTVVHVVSKVVDAWEDISPYGSMKGLIWIRDTNEYVYCKRGGEIDTCRDVYVDKQLDENTDNIINKFKNNANVKP